jgi:pimeloyl-ACP methyl ester carboxylesterase
VLSRRGQDVLSWLLVRVAHGAPALALTSFLRTESSLDGAAAREAVRYVRGDPAQLASFLAMVDSITPRSRLRPGMLDELRAFAEDWHVPWPEIDVPVLAVHSPVDSDVLAEHVDRVRAALPDARILRPPGGHLVWLGPGGGSVVRGTLDHLVRWS